MSLTFFRNLFRDLLRQPLRTFLTLSGVIWGTFAVVLLLAFGTGMQKMMMKQFRGLGQGIMLVFPSMTTEVYQGLPKGRAVQITPEDVMALKSRVPGIRCISPEYTRSHPIRYGKEQLLNTVRGVNPEFAVMRNAIAAKGRFLNDIDMEHKRRVCFLGPELVKNLFKDVEPVGKQVFIDGIPFTVVGVMIDKKQDSNYNGQRDIHCAFVPWTTYRTLFGEKYAPMFIVRPEVPEQSRVFEKRLRAYLGPRLGFSMTDKDALAIWDFGDFELMFLIFFTAFTVFLGVIGSFTLLVGGIGVASIMMVVVEERTREIGVKLAVGARRKTILRQFFSESLFIVLLGGAIGLLLASGLLKVLPAELLEEYVGIPKLNPLVGLVTVTILIIIGTLSGLAPARRAASTDPIVALRK